MLAYHTIFINADPGSELFRVAYTTYFNLNNSSRENLRSHKSWFAKFRLTIPLIHKYRAAWNAISGKKRSKSDS